MTEVSVWGIFKICREARAREGGLGVTGVEGAVKTQHLDGMTLVNISHGATFHSPPMTLSAVRRPSKTGYSLRTEVLPTVAQC